jgi:hypothetical protein
MSLVRWLFSHPHVWFGATLVVGVAYGIGATAAFLLDHPLHLMVHTSVLAVLLLSGTASAIGIAMQVLDRRMEVRAAALHARVSTLDHRNERRDDQLAQKLRMMWPTRTDLPVLRKYQSDPLPSLPAQANRARRALGLSHLDVPREDTGKVWLDRPEVDEREGLT